MTEKRSALADWSPEQIALGKRWVETWRAAGPELEKIRRREIRELDTYRTIALLFGTEGSGFVFEPRPDSGLVGQQRWFMKAVSHS